MVNLGRRLALGSLVFLLFSIHLTLRSSSQNEIPVESCSVPDCLVGGPLGILADRFGIGSDFVARLPKYRAGAARLLRCPRCAGGGLRFEGFVELEVALEKKRGTKTVFDLVDADNAAELIAVLGDVICCELGGEWVMERGVPYVRLQSGFQIAPWSPLVEFELGEIGLRGSAFIFALIHGFLSPKRKEACVKSLESAGF